MTKPRSFAPIIAAVLLLLPVLYVGSYLALVDPIEESAFSMGGGNREFIIVNYRHGGRTVEWFYWPLEQLHRKWRPGKWVSMHGKPKPD